MTTGIVEPPKLEKVEAPKASELKLEAFEELIDTKGGKEKIFSAFVKGPGANVADQISLMLQDLAIPNEVLQVQDSEGNVDQDLIRIDVAGRESKIDIDITKPDMAIAKLKYAISGDYSHVRELQKQN